MPRRVKVGLEAVARRVDTCQTWEINDHITSPLARNTWRRFALVVGGTFKWSWRRQKRGTARNWSELECSGARIDADFSIDFNPVTYFRDGRFELNGIPSSHLNGVEFESVLISVPLHGREIGK